MLNFTIDTERCTRCGLCAKDCVSRAIEPGEKGHPTITEERCIKCQHCLAVCPTGAISILGKDPADSRPIATPSRAQMENLIRSRRSYRHYKEKNIDPKLIDELLQTLAHAPTGVNAQALTFNLIDDTETMRRVREQVLDIVIEETAKESFPAHFAGLKQIASHPREIVDYILFRGAPHALIVSAPPEAPCGVFDTVISTAYFELLAQSAGLGTVWWGYFNLMLAAIPKLQSIFGIPEGHAYSAILFGEPAIKYARTTQKEDAAQIRRITL